MSTRDVKSDLHGRHVRSFKFEGFQSQILAFDLKTPMDPDVTHMVNYCPAFRPKPPQEAKGL